MQVRDGGDHCRRQRRWNHAESLRQSRLPRPPSQEGNQRGSSNDAQWKAEQEKRRKEEAIANATGVRVLSAIGAAVPVRLTKRDLLFVAERLANLLDENRVAILARQLGIKKAKEADSLGKLYAAFLRRSDESTLGRAVVESVILLSASRGNAVAGFEGCGSGLQSGHRCSRHQGQAGVCGQGEGKGSEERLAATAHKSCRQNSEESCSVTNQNEYSVRSLNDQAPLFSAQARRPTLVRAPAEREFILAHPTGRRALCGRGRLTRHVGQDGVSEGISID